MANTYTQIYLHVVFAVEGRQSHIMPEHNDELQKYIAGIVSGQNQKLIAINNMPDHMHLLVGLKPDIALSDLVRDIKAGSSKFINEKHWVRGRFYGRKDLARSRILVPSSARSSIILRTSNCTTPSSPFARNTSSYWKSSTWNMIRVTFSKPGG